jgi:hypothetical protein
MPDLMDYHLDASGLPEEFEAAMRNVYELVQETTGYTATRYLQLLNEYGGLEAARLLLQNDFFSDGLKVLCEKSCLNLSMERMILDRKWRPLFTRDQLQVAANRLHELEADELLRKIDGVSFEDGQPVVDY